MPPQDSRTRQSSARPLLAEKPLLPYPENYEVRVIMLETFLTAAFFAACFLGAFYLFTLPIEIGVAKGLPRKELKPIRILTWCTLFLGFSWFIALFLALSAKDRPPRRKEDCPCRSCRNCPRLYEDCENEDCPHHRWS